LGIRAQRHSVALKGRNKVDAMRNRRLTSNAHSGMSLVDESVTYPCFAPSGRRVLD
jgi:hypothetical protein